MSDIGSLVERLIEFGISVGEASSIIAEAVAAGAATVSYRRSPAAERQKRYRERNKSVTNRNEVTPVENVTNRNESVTKRHTVTTPSLSKIDIKERKRAGSRIVTGWKPSDEERDFARGLGWSDIQIDTEAANFYDYWISLPGAKGLKIDWTATWRKWIRSSNTKPVGAASVGIRTELMDPEEAVRQFVKIGRWSRWAGPEPGMIGCRASRELFAKYGLLEDGRSSTANGGSAQ